MPSRREWIWSTSMGLLACAVPPALAQDRRNEPVEAEMILIPAGPFIMGTSQEEAERLASEAGFHPSWLSGEVPRQVVDLPAYAIDRCPVTNREYHRFCSETGYPPRMHWPGGRPPGEILDHPVTFVNLMDAQAYADWAGKRLPSEAEWEKAARGPDGLMYPWGNEFNPDACRWNVAPGERGPKTAPVTTHPSGASPYGVLDMVGNVGEWCADSPGPGSAIIKGGAWCMTRPVNLRPAARNMSGFANNASDFYGFRCARDVG